MTTETLAPVRKSVTVDVPQQRAFEFFVEHHAQWWPMEGHRIREESTSATIEPREGGRWYESGPDGECQWGHVMAYEPPERLLLAWPLDTTWSFNPDFLTEVEIRFVAESEGSTRVELEHRDIERFGEQAAAVRASLDGGNGWSGVLTAFAEQIGPKGPLADARP